MKFLQNIDRNKCLQLVAGIVGINMTFLIGGVLYEWITKLPYTNYYTKQQQFFRSSVGLIAVQRGLTWAFAQVYNAVMVKRADRVQIPKKNVAICGLIIFISSITFTQAIYLVSFPLTIMSKSCSILSVILVGVLCSRVRDKKLKLGPKKIIVAIVVSFGIIMFRFFDPEVKLDDQKKTQLLGYFFLFLSLLADGFLPDFQAEIKQKYKPTPLQMLTQINKWSFICCLVYSIIVNQFYYTLQFMLNYPLLTTHMVALSILTFIGQMFVYRLIKEFKQHIVPFVVTTRKILTVGFSLIYFHHQTSVGQVLGIILVFFVTLYEFLSEIVKDSSQHLPVPIQDQQKLNRVQNQCETSENILDDLRSQEQLKNNTQQTGKNQKHTKQMSNYKN